MIDADFFLGLAVIFAPFAFVGAVIIRQRKRGYRSRQSNACTPPNANGLPMMGGVDVNGNPFGAVDTHLVNINGLPMAGGVDVLGNSFGTHGQGY
jgi:hypothetical protein